MVHFFVSPGVPVWMAHPKLDYNPHRNAKGRSSLRMLPVLLHGSPVTFGVCVFAFV
jgi:hypothetical protein